MKNWKKVWFALIFIAVAALAFWVIMLLWNWLIPSIIGWSAITYWQAAGLAVLCKLLFGGMGRFHGRHHHGHHKFHRKGHHMHNMTKDEKQEFIRRWMDRDVHKHCHRNESGDE